MNALILAAGMGTRLRPLTDHVPTCLVKVNGQPIIQHQLEALDQAGVRHCAVVVGYLADTVSDEFGPRFGNVDMRYVNNDVFDRTNNLYSLWMAREELNEDLLLLEGDVLFDEGLLGDVVTSGHPDVAVVDRFRPPMNGTVILADGDMSSAMVLKSDQPEGFDYSNALKTVNIYKLSQSTLKTKLVPSLDRYVGAGRTDIYYESVIAELIATGELRLAVHPTGHRRWAEVDDEADLRLAEELLLQTGAVADL